jgi:hypothetical protein
LRRPSRSRALAAHNQALAAQVQQLQARLAQTTKDSHTSSRKPPSSDPRGRKRRRSGKQPGGQLGQAGETCSWWPRPTNGWSIGRRSVRHAKLRWMRRRLSCAMSGCSPDAMLITGPHLDLCRGVRLRDGGYLLAESPPLKAAWAS